MTDQAVECCYDVFHILKSVFLMKSPSLQLDNNQVKLRITKDYVCVLFILERECNVYGAIDHYTIYNDILHSWTTNAQRVIIIHVFYSI